MKRLSMILMAGLLVLGLSQCKKENTNNNNEETEGVKITLTVDNGGEKVNVTPGSSASTVTFQEYDQILVANGGRYVGYLQYSGSAFSGTINETLVTTDKLHFFFVGNKVTPTVGDTKCTVDMDDQRTGPAVISYAATANNYDGSTSVYANVMLLNQASGLVKFTTNIGTTNDIKISGVRTEMSINFATAEIAPTSTIGEMHLYRYTGDSEYKTFLAVIPVQNAVASTVTVEGFTADNITLPNVTQNMYYTGNNGLGVEITLTPNN